MKNRRWNPIAITFLHWDQFLLTSPSHMPGCPLQVKYTVLYQWNFWHALFEAYSIYVKPCWKESQVKLFTLTIQFYVITTEVVLPSTVSHLWYTVYSPLAVFITDSSNTALTHDCWNKTHFEGSSPEASRVAVIERIQFLKYSGSWGRLMECKSTML